MAKNKELRELISEAEAQGWTVDRTKKGWMFKAPNGVDQVAVHGTPSDHRAMRNTVARLRRAGLRWPPK